MFAAPTLGSPAGGAAERSEAEGVPHRSKGAGCAIIDTSYHPTDDTPPDLAFLATLPRGEGKGCSVNQVNTSFAE